MRGHFAFIICQLSRDIRHALNHPDDLFRRVRDKHGELRLSKAAAAYHPGCGVYRSSYKNALRLTATENNMAYRESDHLRWQENPFVIGVRIQVSKTNHPVTDICDELAGDYPKDFKWTGWHPFCRCFATAITASEKERDKYWDAMADGEDVSNWEFKGTIKEMPENFTGWIAANEERIAKAKSMPYFIRDNFNDGDVAKGLRWKDLSIKPEYISKEEFEELSKSMLVTDKERQILYESDDLYIDSSWSREINSELSKQKIGDVVPDDFMDKGSLEQVRTLDAVIAKNQLQEDMWLYRKVSPYWLSREGMEYEVGNVLNEFGFTSTSAVEGANIMRKGKDVLFEIHAPKGTHAYITENVKESEVILPRNTKFKVAEITERDGVKVVRLEVVNESSITQGLRDIDYSKPDKLVSSLLKDAKVYEIEGRKYVKEETALNIVNAALGKSETIDSVNFFDSTRGYSAFDRETKAILVSRATINEYNLSAELRSALATIREGGDLGMHEEYAFECLHHERMHSLAKGWRNGRVESLSRTMEAMNQLVARHSYEQTMAKFGVTPAHKGEIIERGFGYNNSVTNLRELFKVAGLEEKKAVAHLRTQLLNGYYDDFQDYLIRYLSKRGISDAETLVRRISAEPEDFLQMLRV